MSPKANDPKKGVFQRFHPPKRPEDVDQSEKTSPNVANDPHDPNDSVDALFDALQSAKKKRSFSLQEKLGRLGEKIESDSFVPVKRAIVIFLGFSVLVYGTVILVRFLENKTKEVDAFKAAPPIAAPVTPQALTPSALAPRSRAAPTPRHTPPSATKGKTRPKEKDLFEDPVVVDKELEEETDAVEESEEEQPDSPTAKEKAQEASDGDSANPAHDEEKDLEPAEEPAPTPALE